MNKKNKNTKKGFTLIELLVVIAIIGMLASIVLASLNSARSKAANAAVKSNLVSVRSQAALFYDNNSSSYGAANSSPFGNGPCVGGVGLFADPNIIAQIQAAITAGGSGVSYCNSGPATPATQWAVFITLKVPDNSNTFWCVDSNGASKGEQFMAIGALTCG